mmetsp:Transcript_975/g.3002  ORF Transcript_975/g.3002 Transcript_975/m.3002 type:complete len:203 (+) Transcript_975:1506-2114(+)
MGELRQMGIRRTPKLTSAAAARERETTSCIGCPFTAMPYRMIATTWPTRNITNDRNSAAVMSQSTGKKSIVISLRKKAAKSSMDAPTRMLLWYQQPARVQRSDLNGRRVTAHALIPYAIGSLRTTPRMAIRTTAPHITIAWRFVVTGAPAGQLSFGYGAGYAQLMVDAHPPFASKSHSTYRRLSSETMGTEFGGCMPENPTD